jgi:hypothetical protein
VIGEIDMLLYEASRTKTIVDRLVAMANGLGLVITWGSALLWGALFMFLVLLVSRDLWWLGAVAGLAIGFGLGRLLTALLVATLEWMAQVLVAQGEVIARLQGGPLEGNQ